MSLADEIQSPFSKMQEQQLTREVKGLAQVTHDNIVNQYEYFHGQGRTAFMIVMELLPDGSLYDLLKQREKEEAGPLPELEAFQISVDLLKVGPSAPSARCTHSWGLLCHHGRVIRRTGLVRVCGCLWWSRACWCFQ